MLARAKALKNKITDKVSDGITAVARSKVGATKRMGDYDIGVIKQHRALKSRPFQHSKANSRGATGDMRTIAEYQRIKDKYK